VGHDRDAEVNCCLLPPASGGKWHRFALEVWGEAARSPALAERLADAYGEVRASLATLIAGYQDRGLIAADVPPELVAKVLAGLLPGFILQRALLGDVDAECFGAGVGAILATGRPNG
jgi:hypothetical protein